MFSLSDTIVNQKEDPEINHLCECLQKSCPPGNETQKSHFEQCMVKKWSELSLLEHFSLKILLET